MEDESDLSSLEPLIAKPTSPGNVIPVAEEAGKPIAQSLIGSSAHRLIGSSAHRLIPDIGISQSPLLDNDLFLAPLPEDEARDQGWSRGPTSPASQTSIRFPPS